MGSFRGGSFLALDAAKPSPDQLINEMYQKATRGEPTGMTLPDGTTLGIGIAKVRGGRRSAVGHGRINYNVNGRTQGREAMVNAIKKAYALDGWNEADHPRGQPNNAGQFAAGGAPGPAAAAAKRSTKAKGADPSHIVSRMMSNMGSFANESAKADEVARLTNAIGALSSADRATLRKELRAGEDRPTIKDASKVIDKMALAYNGGSYINDIHKKNTVKKIVNAVYSLEPEDFGAGAAKPKDKGGSLKGEPKPKKPKAEKVAKPKPAKASKQSERSHENISKGFKEFMNSVNANTYEEASKKIDAMTAKMPKAQLQELAEQALVMGGSKATKSKIIDGLKKRWLEDKRFQEKTKDTPKPPTGSKLAPTDEGSRKRMKRGSFKETPEQQRERERQYDEEVHKLAEKAYPV
jgi:hypothetical protein